MNIVDTVCIELTASCPLTCAHCSASASPMRQETIDSSRLLKGLAELAPFQEIYLSGGEPFAHPHILTIAREASRLAKSVTVYSSGVIEQEHQRNALSRVLLAESAKAGISRIDLSIYAAQHSTHDAVTRTSGSLALTIRSARRIITEGLALGIHYVPVAYQAGQLKEVAQLAEDLGASRLHVLAITPQGRARSLPPSSYSSDLLKTLHSLLVTHRRYELIVSSALRQALGLMETTPRDRLQTAVIDPGGYIYPGENRRSPYWRSHSPIGGTEPAPNLISEVLLRISEEVK